jgi:hypothetical protein
VPVSILCAGLGKNVSNSKTWMWEIILQGPILSVGGDALTYIWLLQELNCQMWHPRLWPSQRQFIIDWLINWLLQKVESLGKKKIDCKLWGVGTWKAEKDYIQQQIDWFTRSLISSSFNRDLWVLLLCLCCVQSVLTCEWCYIHHGVFELWWVQKCFPIYWASVVIR